MSRKKRYQRGNLKLEDGQWKLRYYDETGKRRTRCLGTKKTTTAAEAKRAADDILTSINRRADSGLERHDYRVRDVVEMWERTVKPTTKVSTARVYDWVIRRLGEPGGGILDAPITNLSRVDIQEWLMALTTHYGFKPRTVKVLRGALSGFLSYAVDWGWINTNPAYGLYRNMPKPEKLDRPSITPEMVSYVVGFMDVEMRAVFIMALLSGLRKCELSGLRREDIVRSDSDPNLYIINVRRKWDYNVTRKLSADGRSGGFGPTKSSKERKVEVGPAVWSVLSDWYKIAPGSKIAPESELVLPGRRVGRPRHLGSLMQKIQTLCVKLGCPRFRWHDLRANYTTWCRKAGVRAEIVRDQLGHSSVQLTLDVYAQTADRERVSERVENLLIRYPTRTHPHSSIN